MSSDRLPPAEPWRASALADSEVHAIGFALDLEAGAVAELAACLAPHERAHARRYHHERDRRRNTVGRARLRELLAAYTGSASAQLEFASGPHGKPALAGDDAGAALQFNLSHSAGRALLAVVRARAIGVDIEEVRDIAESELIARRHFAPAEFAQWLALPAARRIEGFYAVWTRKEAYLKAIGAGLSIDLHGFEVSTDPDGPARLLGIGGSAAAARGWTMWSTEPWPAFRAALAVEGTGLALRCFELD
jgi:4'-phosphopantetheinyl transferase